MVTGAIKNKVDKIWTDIWAGGITNPLTVIEQLTYLMFIRSLDEKELAAEDFENMAGEKMEHIFGKLGAPAMGVTGAAIATLVSQLLNLLLILIGFAVCFQKEVERPLTVEIWTRWAGVLCLFSEYNGEPDLLFRLAQVKSAAIGDSHAQLIERTGGKFRYSLAVLVCDRPQCRIDLC